MRVVCRKVLLVFLMLTCAAANAYELATHGHMTYEVYKKSVLIDNNFLQQLGIINGKNPFGLYYYDVSGSTVRQRKQDSFEERKDRMPKGAAPFSIEGWLMRGAIREDDLPFTAFPGDTDPYGGIFRVFRHFYDPVKDRALTKLLLPTQEKAPNWALGTNDFLANPDVSNDTRRNHFTVRDAREAMFRALTGMSGSGDTNIGPNNTPVTEDVRKAYWATTFRALGDVLHLVEDMAQPQHTRNDAHLLNGTLDKQAYEKYTEMRAKQQGFRCSNGVKRTPPALVYGTYPVPAFARYSDFFSTVTGTPPRDPSAGIGIADYSNRGFYSAGTNVEDSTYPYPQLSALTPKSVNIVNPCLPTTGASSISKLFEGLVPDTVNPGYVDTMSDGTAYDATKIPLTARGMLQTDELGPGTFLTEAYTLTDQNYIATADLLIPRAVSYSAGLIDYFFRGRLETVEAVSGGNAVDLKVKNATNYVVNGANNETLYAGGILVLTVRYTNSGANYNITSNQVVVAQDIAPGATGTALDADGITPIPYRFTLPQTIPNTATNIEYRLVFRGQLGNESDAVAVGICEPCIQQRIDLSYTPPGSNDFATYPYFETAETLTTESYIYCDEGETRPVSHEYVITYSKSRGLSGSLVIATGAEPITVETYYNFTGFFRTKATVSLIDSTTMDSIIFNDDEEIESWIEAEISGQVSILPNSYERILVNYSGDKRDPSSFAGYHYEYKKSYKYSWFCTTCTNGLNYNAQVIERIKDDMIFPYLINSYDIDERVTVKDIQVRNGIITSEIIISDVTTSWNLSYFVGASSERRCSTSPLGFPAEGGTKYTSGEAVWGSIQALANGITESGICPLE